MSGLVHHWDELDDDVHALKCPRCQERFDDFGDATIGDTIGCPACRTGGMIPLRGSRVEDRFPVPLSKQFTALPSALMDHRATLGLGPHELVVVWALERHRWGPGDEVFPSAELLGELTGLSDGQLKRATRRLVDKGLVKRRRPRLKGGILGSSRYQLDPLWNRLAELSTGHERPVEGATTGHPRPVERSDTTTGHQRPMDHGSPLTFTTGHQRPTEVEAVEKQNHKEQTRAAPGTGVADAPTGGNRDAHLDDPNLDRPSDDVTSNQEHYPDYTDQWLQIQQALRRPAA